MCACEGTGGWQAHTTATKQRKEFFPCQQTLHQPLWIGTRYIGVQSIWKRPVEFHCATPWCLLQCHSWRLLFPKLSHQTGLSKHFLTFSVKWVQSDFISSSWLTWKTLHRYNENQSMMHSLFWDSSKCFKLVPKDLTRALSDNTTLCPLSSFAHLSCLINKLRQLDFKGKNFL